MPIHIHSDGKLPVRSSTVAAVPLFPRRIVQSAACGSFFARPTTAIDKLRLRVCALEGFHIRCPTKARLSSRQYFALPYQERCRPIAMDTTFSQLSNRRHLRPMPPSRQQQAPCPSAMANCFASPTREPSLPTFSLLCTCLILASPVFRRG